MSNASSRAEIALERSPSPGRIIAFCSFTDRSRGKAASASAGRPNACCGSPRRNASAGPADQAWPPSPRRSCRPYAPKLTRRRCHSAVPFARGRKVTALKHCDGRPQGLARPVRARASSASRAWSRRPIISFGQICKNWPSAGPSCAAGPRPGPSRSRGRAPPRGLPHAFPMRARDPAGDHACPR